MTAIGWFVAFGLSALASASVPAEAQAPQPQRQLAVGGAFLDTIQGSWIGDEPEFARKPSAEQLQAALGGTLPRDFGLAFSCWVQSSGALRDCHTTMTAPSDADGAALTRALAPLVRLTPPNARTAVDEEYRLSVRVALSTMSASGLPASCYPPFCVANDPPPPPPPQPGAKDPLIAMAIKQAQDCFSSRWDRAAGLRTAAEQAVSDNQEQPAPESVRAAVLAYVNARIALKSCIAQLEDVSHRVPAFGNDETVMASAIASMRSNYALQTPPEVAVLAGLLDKNAGEAERSFPVP